ncbi:hypothetical protein [Clostridium sp. 'White wine YQ']|uniref:hypothetical protein n=1 Tax=Clostridium sp. 'White wine YQ' TaxID=3027474 RepID=UPI00236521D4|nr:hypothetical protein [Clostridium sp. 'White wine YQ']MDD7792893.1 hypothetical protein [Clostridium sp. 'White wine YQ']
MGLSADNIIIALVAIVFLFLAIKFIRGVIKGIIVVLLILTLGVSAYNIFITKKSIGYEVNRYKTDYLYFKSISSISSHAIENIDAIKEGKNIKENTDELIILKNHAETLEHSSEINGIHNNYIRGLDTVIVAAKGYKTANEAKEQADKLQEASNSLNISLKDILSGQ